MVVKDSKRLLPRQKAFCVAYVKYRANGEKGAVKKAWEAAGYRGDHARGHKLLKDDAIKKYIERIEAEEAKKYEITREWIERELVENYYEVKESDRFDLSLEHLKAIAKFKGLDTPERVEVSGPNGGPLESRSVAAFFVAEDILKPRGSTDD